jgi:ribonuclease D
MTSTLATSSPSIARRWAFNPHRDRLCVVQLSSGDGNAHLVQVEKGQTEAPNLARLLTDPNVLKLFHFGRFDIAVMDHTFGALAAPSIAPRSRRS